MAVTTDAAWAVRTAKSILLIRVLVGWVFLSEGIQRFLFPDALGVGRFVKIGIPWPHVMAPFVGLLEIVWRNAAVVRTADAPRRDSTSHRHLRCAVFNQNRHFPQERTLEHAARSSHGREHAARSGFPSDRR